MKALKRVFCLAIVGFSLIGGVGTAATADNILAGKFVKVRLPFTLNQRCARGMGDHTCVPFSVTLTHILFFTKKGSVLFYMNNDANGQCGTGMEFPAAGGTKTFTENGVDYIGTYRPKKNGFDFTFNYVDLYKGTTFAPKLTSTVSVNNGKCTSKTAVSGYYTENDDSVWYSKGRPHLTGKETCTVSDSR